MTERARMKSGHTRVFVRDGSSYVLDPSQFETILGVWMSGAAFLRTVGLYGSPVVIKCAEIQGMSLSTAEALAASADDDLATERETKARQMLDGE